MIQQELRKAVVKHPNWPRDPIHQAAVVSEEAGELVQACLDSVYDPRKTEGVKVQREAIQVAASAIRFLINFDETLDPRTYKSTGKGGSKWFSHQQLSTYSKTQP